ncbi:MAG TPA: hypothetical protein VGD18_03425, partial [Thiobacillaceae bacterium]
RSDTPPIASFLGTAMPSTLLSHFASLLRRWIADLATLVTNPHRLHARDQSLAFRGRDAAATYLRARSSRARSQVNSSFL